MSGWICKATPLIFYIHRYVLFPTEWDTTAACVSSSGGSGGGFEKCLDRVISIVSRVYGDPSADRVLINIHYPTSRGDPRDIANDDGLYRIPVDIGKRRTVGYNIRGNQEPHLAVSEIVRTQGKANAFPQSTTNFTLRGVVLTANDLVHVAEYLMSGSPRSYPARSPGVASTPTVTREP
ncbi:teneurin-a isoform X1 [Vespula squamosa]|uniref:Teneurin-a isoform X1 n=1 Tax=Vespula squamosa TaxID=30214 RepID=A0ABD2A7G6_VESSQ